MTLFQKRAVYIGLGGLFAAILIAVFYWKKDESVLARQVDAVEANPAFAKYISAYSGGMLPSAAPVRVVFAYDVKDSVNKPIPLDKEVFSFSPSIDGKAYWVAPNILEFKPDEKLPSGEFYTAELKLGEVMEVAESELRDFEFSFSVIPQNFDVVPIGLSFYEVANRNKVRYSGKIITADKADIKEVEKILRANQENVNKKITWPEAGRKATEFPFVIEDVIRKGEKEFVSLDWDGSAIDVEKTGGLKIEIPAQGDFVFMNHYLETGDDRFLKLFFSEPLDPDKDLQGLIQLVGGDFKYLVNENEVRIYPSQESSTAKSLTIDKSITSAFGQLLGKNYTIDVIFGSQAPALEMTGSGVIVPGNGKLLVPFKSINLKAVEATVMKIPEQNMGFFLQESELSGGYSYELNRVAIPVMRRTFSLAGQQGADFSNWKHYHIDLSKYLQPEPGALYRVELTYKREHTACNCPDENAEDNSWWSSALSMINPAKSVPEAYDGNGYYYGEDEGESEYSYEEIDWSKREDPCNPAFYYYGGRAQNRNLLASNLGLLAKGNTDGSYLMHVSNLMTAEMQGGVELELYDFQRQLICKSKSESDGSCLMKPSRRPFLLIAKNGKDRGYLKLQDGNSLSLSNFDVSGDKIEKGIKGFIFGERGVWRPGDSLMLTFILNDVQNPLPKKHPLALEIFNPNDQLFKKYVKATDGSNMYTFRISLPESAPTGNWKAKVSIGGASFSKNLKIEAIKPNRLKINLDFGAEKLSAGMPMNGRLNVSWLHGAPVSNLKAVYEATFSAASTSFPQWKNFTFDNPAQKLETESQVLFDGRLDKDGNAVISPKLSFSEKAPATININMKGKVFEESGDFSVDYLTLPYCPFTSLVGLQKSSEDADYLETGRNNKFQVININPQGQLLSGNRIAKVSLWKLDWRWWWENTEEDLAYYVDEGYARPVSTDRISLQGGRADWNVKLDDDAWGRYLMVVEDEKSGHRSGQVVFFDWPASYSRESRYGSNWANLLTLHALKPNYKTGEEIQINVPTPGGARLLVSLENSSRVIKTFTQETSQGNSTIRFKAEGAMAPNIFVHVTLVQPWKDRKNDLPLRKYGVIAVPVEDPASRLLPTITVANELAPAKPFNLSIKENSGQDMDYVVAVVDEGLLSLTRFKTPDPHKTFFAREALGVKTWDLFDQVIGAYGADLEKMLAIGGDEGLNAKGGVKQSRFKPVAMLLGPFKAKGGQAFTHKINMPNYIGAVRVMVIAAGKNSYGNAEKTCQVRQPLMVMGTLPRVIGPNEEIKLPVTLFTYDKNINATQVKVVTDGATQVVGAASQNLNLAGKQESMTYFTLKAGTRLGSSKIKILASSGKHSSAYEVWLPVRNPFQPVTVSKEWVIEPGKQAWVEVPSPGGIGQNANKLEIASGPSLNLGERLSYLIQYPHGCVEQTVSAAFPQLYLPKLAKISTKQRESMTKNVKACIERLSGFQVSEGGFSYWPGELTASEWGSNYAGHFLVESQRMGYQVPSTMIRKWKKFQSRLANEYVFAAGRRDAQIMQGYRLYTLAMANAPELGAMNRLKEQSGIDQVARWYLACAYSLVGRKDVATRLLNNVPVQFTNYRELSYTFGSDERDKAVLLETYSNLGDVGKTWQMMKEVSKILSSREWMSTQATAYCLSAASRFLIKTGSDNSWKAAVTTPGSKETEVAGTQPYYETSFQSNVGVPVKCLIKNEGKGALYVRLTSRGTPTKELGIVQNSGMDMSIAFKDKNGNSLDPSNLVRGTDLNMVVNVQNTSGIALKELALTLPIPAGWELSTTRMDGTDPAQKLGARYLDIRDDKIMVYFDLAPNENKQLLFSAISTYAGSYFMPALQCEAMYDGAIAARIPGRWVVVK